MVEDRLRFCRKVEIAVDYWLDLLGLPNQNVQIVGHAVEELADVDDDFHADTRVEMLENDLGHFLHLQFRHDNWQHSLNLKRDLGADQQDNQIGRQFG